MDTTIVLSVILGVCLTLFILFFVRDVLFKHYISMVMSDVTVQPVVNSNAFIEAVSSYVKVLESTLELLESLLKSNVLNKDDRDVVLQTKNSLENNITTLNCMIQDFRGVFKDGNR